jgi:uncharacterized BrkB/YihY/UPF0761 family membrane protein
VHSCCADNHGSLPGLQLLLLLFLLLLLLFLLLLLLLLLLLETALALIAAAAVDWQSSHTSHAPDSNSRS